MIDGKIAANQFRYPLRGGSWKIRRRALQANEYAARVDRDADGKTVYPTFSELAARGIISAAPGRGYFICPDAQQVLAKLWHERLKELRALCAELAQAGITWEEILQSAEQGYQSGATLFQEEGTK